MVCLGNVLVISPMKDGGYPLSYCIHWRRTAVRRGATPSTEAPERNRPMTRREAVMGWCKREFDPLMSGSCWRGIQSSGGSPRSVSPKKPGGAMPVTLNALPSTMSVDPMTATIASIAALPGAIAQYRDRSGGWPVVSLGQKAPGERPDAEGLEVI